MPSNEMGPIHIFAVLVTHCTLTYVVIIPPIEKGGLLVHQKVPKKCISHKIFSTRWSCHVLWLAAMHVHCPRARLQFWCPLKSDLRWITLHRAFDRQIGDHVASSPPVLTPNNLHHRAATACIANRDSVAPHNQMHSEEHSAVACFSGGA